MSKLAQEFVDLILKRNPSCDTVCGAKLLYNYYCQRPGIIYPANDLTDRQKCIMIIQNREEFLEKMNGVTLPDYFFS